MKITSFYSEGELSSIRVSNVDDMVNGVKDLLFEDQLVEEKIRLEIYTTNSNKFSQVDELRLDFDRIYSKKQIIKKSFFGRYKFIDSAKFKGEFSIKTILNIKNEEAYLNARFQDYLVLIPKNSIFSGSQEPMLFASLKNNNFYLLNGGDVQGSLKTSSKFKKITAWIQKGISSKTSSK